jgi:hypothetical protein
MNLVFATCSEENAACSLTVQGIAESQSADVTMGKLKNYPEYAVQLVENTVILCKDDKLVIPKDLQHQTVEWYRHHLHHPGLTHLKETLCSAMYWKRMQHTIQSHLKKCHSCWMNKQCMQ